MAFRALGDFADVDTHLEHHQCPSSMVSMVVVGATTVVPAASGLGWDTSMDSEMTG